MENPFELIDERLQRIENLLSQILAEKPFFQIVTTGKEIMSLEDLAEYISLSKGTIYRMTMNNEIPFSKPSKKLLFRKVEIDEWIKTHRSKTYYEIEQEAANYLLKRRSKF